MSAISSVKERKQMQDWHVIARAIIILLITFYIIFPVSGQTELIGGRSYTFSGTTPQAGETYSYLWTVSDGWPQKSTDQSFEWGAPTVGEPTNVTVTLEVRSGESICSNRSELELLILPPPPQPGELASISLKKDCIFTPPVRVGDSITYTYNVTNDGDVPLNDTSLTDITDINHDDVHHPGPSCTPVYVRGDNGNRILDPGESWFYECKYSVPDYHLMHIMSNGSEEEAINQSRHIIIQRLHKLKPLLEIKMDSMKASRQRFNTRITTLKIDHMQNYTLYNYTNKITGESLSRRIDPTGKINRTDYYDPVTHVTLSSKYNPDGSLKSDDIPILDSELIIEYDKPYKGDRFYTITDFSIPPLPPHWNTMKQVVRNGFIISENYSWRAKVQLYEEKYFLNNTASVTANDPYGVPVSANDSFSLKIQLPILTIAKKADPNPVIPGGTINYTITYRNIGAGAAHNVVVKEKYSQNVVFLSADPLPDPGTTDTWSIGDLPDGGEPHVIKIAAKVSPDAGAGSSIMNEADITSNENAPGRAMINTTVKGVGLNITKSASSCCVKAGNTLTYTINYRNDGPDVQTNVTIDDYLDPNVDFISSNPSPAGISGRHYWWNVGNLNPGDSGWISINILVKASAPDSIYNNYRIESDQAKVSNASLETMVVSSLWIRKTADKNACNPGDNITYTILFGNDEVMKVASNVFVIDLLPDVELLSASPAPISTDSNKLIWNIGDLEPQENRTIILVVHIPEKPETSFNEESSVKGEGYIYIHKKLSTVEEKPSLINKAYINGTYAGDPQPYNASSTSTVTIAGAAGTELSTYEHGSGYYKEEELSSLRSKNHSVALNKDISAQHENTVFSLPGGRSIGYQSLWYDRTEAKNHVLNDAVTENYLYMDSLDKNSSFRADMNKTVYHSESDFSGGIARVNYRKYATNSTSTINEISENYHGSFRLNELVDSYGESTNYKKSANGNGFVSSDERAFKPVSSKRTDLLQRSYEYGSGYYKSDGSIQLTSLTKSAMMAYAPANLTAGIVKVPYGSLWNEGMITRDLANKLILSERLRSASYINKDAWMDTSSLSFMGEFNGTMDLRAVMNPRGKDKDTKEIDQSFIGSYQISTAITAYNILKYNYPHVSITKEAVREDESTILFLINITNDGNGLLKTLYITDQLPRGMIFISSSLRPEISGRIINWTVPSLDIGRRLTIKLRAQSEDNSRPYTNIATVTAQYNGHTLTASNFTSFTPNYLPCCFGRYPKEVAYLAKVFNTSIVQGQWGEWRPSPCFNVTSNETDCFRAIDDYYNDLDKSESECCAASSYEVP